MKNVIKSILHLFKRYRLAAILNILGLSAAFAAFTIIMTQVDYEYGFDKVHIKSDRIYRVNKSGEGVFSRIMPRPFLEEIIRSSSHIQKGAIVNPYVGLQYFTIEHKGVEQGFRESVIICSPDFTEIFDFRMVEGDKNSLKEPEKILIPLSIAEKLFGKESAIGQTLYFEDVLWTKNRKELVVGGVYKDFPGNTQINNVLYTAISPEAEMSNWDASNFQCFLLLDDPRNAGLVIDNFNNSFDWSKISWSKDTRQIHLTPLADIYFFNEEQDGRTVKSGSKDSVNLMLLIGFLIIIIAAVNFMNFNSSLAPVRIKAINTRKVLGCPVATLRVQILVETAVVSIVAYLIGLLYLYLLAHTGSLSFIDADIYPGNNLSLVLFGLLLATLIGVLVGIYPAVYMTSFSPAIVLKGNFQYSSSGKKLRTVLVGFQYVISMILIISALFVWMQNRYMQKFALGFDKEQIAIVELNNKFYNSYKESYVNQLKSWPGIEDVAFSIQKLGGQDSYSTNRIPYKGETFSCYTLFVSWNFLETMGIELIGGRKPTPADESKERPFSLVFNKSAMVKYNMETPSSIENSYVPMEIIGFVEDVKFTSLRKGVDNLAFSVNKSYSLPVSYIRLKSGVDYFEAVKHIRKTLSEIDPTYSFEVEFYDTLFDQLYNRERKSREMLTLFSLLAIIISVMGVFGMVIFETANRRKEIGIRKVLGSDTREILYMFNKYYIWIVVICFFIALPFTYYSLNVWMQSFAFRIPLYWWVFLFSGIVVVAITVFIVSWQSWKTAISNPVDSIKSE